MVVSCVEKTLEVLVGDRILVDVESLHMHEMLMKAAGRVLPWILHIHSFVVGAFDFNSPDGKQKVSTGKMNHFRRSRGSRFGRSDVDDSLRQNDSLFGVAR